MQVEAAGNLLNSCMEASATFKGSGWKHPTLGGTARQHYGCLCHQNRLFVLFESLKGDKSKIWVLKARD